MNSWLAMLPTEPVKVKKPEDRHARYRELHREELRKRDKARRKKNRDKINARKRERYAQGKGRAA